jgi:hypothetical protein
MLFRPFQLEDLGNLKAIAPKLIHLYWANKSSLLEGTLKELVPTTETEYVLVIEFTTSQPFKKSRKRFFNLN